jgi:hypothetical protein
MSNNMIWISIKKNYFSNRFLNTLDEKSFVLNKAEKSIFVTSTSWVYVSSSYFFFVEEIIMTFRKKKLENEISTKNI